MSDQEENETFTATLLLNEEKDIARMSPQQHTMLYMGMVQALVMRRFEQSAKRPADAELETLLTDAAYVTNEALSPVAQCEYHDKVAAHTGRENAYLESVRLALRRAIEASQ